MADYTPHLQTVFLECNDCSALILDQEEAKGNHTAWHLLFKQVSQMAHSSHITIGSGNGA